jgi:hypothetical protein
MSSERLRYNPSHDRISTCIELARLLDDRGLFRNCLNCAKWNDTERGDANTGCSKYQKLPPPSVIVSGCPEHSDLIPF